MFLFGFGCIFIKLGLRLLGFQYEAVVVVKGDNVKPRYTMSQIYVSCVIYCGKAPQYILLAFYWYFPEILEIFFLSRREKVVRL